MNLGLGPSEGACGMVVGVDECIDVVPEFLDAGEARALKRLTGQEGEPALDNHSLACRLAQSGVDPVLPSRTVLLEVFEHLLVNAQGDGLLHTRDGRSLGRRINRLRRNLLERSLGRLQWIAGAPPAWRSRQVFLLMNPCHSNRFGQMSDISLRTASGTSRSGLDAAGHGAQASITAVAGG